MFPIATTKGGTCKAVPDVCKTPAPPPVNQVPVPYVNSGMLMQATPTTVAKKVTVVGFPALTMNSKIAMTSGDEAGSLGGVISGTIKGPAQFNIGSFSVEIEGSPAVYQTCMTGQNGSSANAPVGLHDSPSQADVKIAM